MHAVLLLKLFAFYMNLIHDNSTFFPGNTIESLKNFTIVLRCHLETAMSTKAKLAIPAES